MSMKSIKLINVKMSTIVGILTFISMINIIMECFKPRKITIFQHLSVLKQEQSLFFSTLCFMCS